MCCNINNLDSVSTIHLIPLLFDVLPYFVLGLCGKYSRSRSMSVPTLTIVLLFCLAGKKVLIFVLLWPWRLQKVYRVETLQWRATDCTLPAAESTGGKYRQLSAYSHVLLTRLTTRPGFNYYLIFQIIWMFGLACLECQMGEVWSFGTIQLFHWGREAELSNDKVF